MVSSLFSIFATVNVINFFGLTFSVYYPKYFFIEVERFVWNLWYNFFKMFLNFFCSGAVYYVVLFSLDLVTVRTMWWLLWFRFIYGIVGDIGSIYLAAKCRFYFIAYFWLVYSFQIWGHFRFFLRTVAHFVSQNLIGFNLFFLLIL